MGNKSKNKKRGKKIITLKDALHRIYCNIANLETTCKGQCICCKVACPSMNHSEFLQIWSKIHEIGSEKERLQYILKSIEYFFKYRFDVFGKETLYKPCMLLTEKGRCRYYSDRPLNCRLYGLWPEAEYNARVDKFEKAYEGKLTRDELPLNKQCPYVKRVDESKPLTMTEINKMFAEIDALDARFQKFTPLQIKRRHNYRTFHDWVMYTVFGEEALVALSEFIMKASKEVVLDQIQKLQDAVKATGKTNVSPS